MFCFGLDLGLGMGAGMKAIICWKLVRDSINLTQEVLI
jgi:hypothetical protein